MSVDFANLGYGLGQSEASREKSFLPSGPDQTNPLVPDLYRVDIDELVSVFDNISFSDKKSGKGEKESAKPMTLLELNAIGIIGVAQDPNEFLANVSDLHRLSQEVPKRKREMLAGLSVGSAAYEQRMNEFLEWAVAYVNETLLTSEKLPGPLRTGIKWYNNLRNDEEEPKLFDETTVYETDQFSSMTLRQDERFRLMFNPGPWMEIMQLTYYSFLTSASYIDDLGLNVVLTGPPSSGKSYITQKVATVFPPGTVRSTSGMTPKALCTGGCDDEMFITLFDEVTKFMIGADEKERGSELESIMKRVMTLPYTLTKAYYQDENTKQRSYAEHYATHYGVRAGCYDGKLPGPSSPLGLRWTMLTVNVIDMQSPDSIIDRVNAQVDPEVQKVKRQLLHIQTLVSFFVQLFSVYIKIGVIDEPDMNALKQYFHMYRESMAAAGFVLTDQKNYNKQHGVARVVTIRYAAHIALFSDLTRKERFADGKYVSFFDKPLYFIKIARAYMFCTRAIAVYTFSLTRFLFGNQTGSQVASTAFRYKVARHLPVFHESCFPDDFILRLRQAEAKHAVTASTDVDRLTKRTQLIQTLMNRAADDDDFDESDKDALYNADKLGVDSRDYDEDGDSALAHMEDPVAEQLHLETTFLQQLAEHEKMQVIARRETTLSDAMRAVTQLEKGSLYSDADKELAEKRKRRREAEASESLQRAASAASFSSTTSGFKTQVQLDNEMRAAEKYLCDRIPFLRTYALDSGDVSKVDVNYIDMTDNEEPYTNKVVAQLRANFGSCKPSIEVLTKALTDLCGTEMAVPKFEIDPATKMIRVKLDPKTGKPIIMKMPVVKIISNTRAYDKATPAGSKRVLFLTRWVLARHSLASAVKRSIEALGFDCAVPGIVLTSMPKWISVYGNTQMKKREASHRVYMMIEIKPNPNKKLIIYNTDPISSELRESLAQTIRLPGSTLRTFKPAAWSQVPALRIEIEPEVVTALAVSAQAAVDRSFVKLTVPQILERALFNRRFANGSDLAQAPTFKYTETAVRNAVAANRGRMPAFTRDSKIVLSNADFVDADPSERQHTLDVGVLTQMMDSNITSAYNMLFSANGEMRHFANAAQLAEVAPQIRARYMYQKAGGKCDIVVGSWDTYRKNAHLTKRRAITAVTMQSIKARFAQADSAVDVDVEPDLSERETVPMAPPLRTSELLGRLNDEQSRHSAEINSALDLDVTQMIQHEMAEEQEMHDSANDGRRWESDLDMMLDLAAARVRNAD
jgi:hypothetical protein